jgi:hypothetical protein
MFYHALLRYFPSLTFESRGGLKSHKRFPQHQNTMSGSCLPQVACMMAYVLFMLFVFLFAAYSGVQHVLTI